MKKKLFVIGIGGLTGSKLAEIAEKDFEIFGSYNYRDPKSSIQKNIKLDIYDNDGDDVQIGQPYIEHAKVIAEIVEEVKGDKVTILRFRRRKHSMRKIGHRQRYTQIKIKEINVGK